MTATSSELLQLNICELSRPHGSRYKVGFGLRVGCNEGPQIMANIIPPEIFTYLPYGAHPTPSLIVSVLESQLGP